VCVFTLALSDDIPMTTERRSLFFSEYMGKLLSETASIVRLNS
jgi:hypothetical protein